MHPEGQQQEGCRGCKFSKAMVPNSPLPLVMPGGESDMAREVGGDIREGELVLARFSSPVAQWGKDTR